jgi:peptide deformylase
MDATELRVRLYGDPALRSRARAVLQVTDEHRRLLSAMARIMYDSVGIGLAAPQVGLREAMIVVDIGSGLYKLINPVVIQKQGTQALEEGCLSVPGVCIKVKRARKIVVSALNEEGKAVTIEAEDLLACVLQHEIDHLKAKLIVDYASFLEKRAIKKKLAALRASVRNERMSESETKSCKLQL